VTLWSNFDVNGFCACTVATDDITIVETNDKARHIDLNELLIVGRYSCYLLARFLPFPDDLIGAGCRHDLSSGNVDKTFGSGRGDHEL
jgi:hypothetical protein